MLKEEAAEIIEHEEYFYQSGEFWVSVAFVLLIACLFSPMLKIIKKAINGRIQRIKDDLQTAETLKIDAQKLYAEYERKFQNTDKEVAEIIANKQEAIEQTKAQKIHGLELLLKQKEREADAKINYIYTQAKAEINKRVIEKAVNLVSSAAAMKLNKKDYDKLISQSISNIEKYPLNIKNNNIF